MSDNSSSPASEWTQGPWRDRYVCCKYELVRAAKSLAKLWLGRIRANPIKCRVSNWQAKAIVLRERLANVNGAASWFYYGIDRGGEDPLTNYELDHIVQNIPKQGRVLVTGCGTGITAFHLADCGYREVVGIDLLPQAIAVANLIKVKGEYRQTSFYQGDCFAPAIPATDEGFDLITALHWLFSAWHGNYGNSPVSIDRAKDPKVREELLCQFLATWASHLKAGGVLVFETTDAVTDYRLESDHRLGSKSAGIYPVRHTPEQVRRCSEAYGLRVYDQKLCVSYGHHPRTGYFLKKA